MDKKERKGKSTIRFPLIYLITVALMTAVLIMAAYMYIQYRSVSAESIESINDFEGTYKFMLSKVSATEREVENDLCIPARLTASALRQSGADLETGGYGVGWIIRKGKNKIRYPEGYRDSLRMELSDLPSEYSSIHIGKNIVSCARIKDDYYYVEIRENTEETEAVRDGVNYQDALDNLAAATGNDYLSLNSDGSGDYTVTAGTGSFASVKKASELGLTDLIDGTDDTAADVTRVEGRLCVAVCSKEFSLRFEPDEAAVMIMPLRNALLRAAALAASLVFYLAIIGIPLAVWLISVFRRIRNGIFKKEELERYSYSNVKRRTIAVVAAATVAALFLSLFAMSLDDLFVQTSKGGAVLKAYFRRLDGDTERRLAQWEGCEERYQYNAKRLASLIDSNRSLQNSKDWLEEASDIIDADYIMIFDEHGDELISDSPYKGISLKDRANPDMSDFSRLFNGVDSISHDGVKDEITGLTRDFHGVCLRYLADEDSYGALLVAVDPAEHSWISFRDFDDIASSMVSSGAVIMEADPKTGEITHSSNRSLTGTRIKKAQRSDSFMGFMDLKGRLYFAVSRAHDSMLYYYGKDKEAMFKYDMLFSVCYAVFFLIVTGFLAAMLIRRHPLRGREKEDSSDRGDIYKISSDRMDSLSTFILNTAENNMNLMSLEEELPKGRRSWSDIYRSVTPEREAATVFELLLSIFTLAVTLLIVTHNGEGTVFDFITEGKWVHGLNLFAFAAVFFIFCDLIVFLAFLKLVSALAENVLSGRSLTIAALMLNVLWYAALTVFIILSLSYLGVDTRALAASVGLLGLAITMGFRDIVSDLLAGISIIASRSFEVGDTVEISGFGTGVVKLIGLRSTQLHYPDGTDSYIRNSSITGVVNHSREKHSEKEHQGKDK